MSECAYYLKAEFPTEAIAEKVEPQLNAFFVEARKAYDDNDLLDLKRFLSMFSERYPLVMEYATTSNFKEYNDLSGYFDFGQDNDEVFRKGNVLRWCSSRVGHMTDWTPLATFIKNKFGAIKVIWGNEENGCASFDSLPLYAWEEIVKDILKHKELRPLLLHINDELDQLLAQTLRREK